MTFGNSSDARIAYVAEVTPGITPNNPTFQVARVTGGGLRSSKSTQTSNELQPDRNVRDEILQAVSASGNYPFELSYGTFDDWLEGLLFGSWSMNVLKNGITRRFFTFEETVELGGTDSYSRFPMGMFSRGTLDIQAGQIITGSFEVMAQRETLGAAILSGATYTPAGTTPIMSGGVSVGTLSVAGASPTPKVRRIQIEIANNLRQRPVLGTPYSEEFGHGRFDVTGTLEAYFESNTLFQSVLDHGGGDLSVTLGHETGEKYTVDLPNVRWLDGARQIGGNDDDVILTIPFRGLYDESAEASIQITRAVA